LIEEKERHGMVEIEKMLRKMMRQRKIEMMVTLKVKLQQRGKAVQKITYSTRMKDLA
jgi:hypothetical protein